MKKNRHIQINKNVKWSIPMAWNIYKEYSREQDKRFHANQYINYYRMDYVLKRYYDWIMYRTHWFYRSHDQRVGPEYALMGNNKIVWTTADKKAKDEREGMVGISNWVNRFNLPGAAAKKGVFLTGTHAGKFKATPCENRGACRKLFYEQYNRG